MKNYLLYYAKNITLLLIPLIVLLIFVSSSCKKDKKDNTISILTPANPHPSDGAINVLDTAISWGNCNVSGNTATYDIYFGTTPNLIQSSYTTTYYKVFLNYGTKYYWKIVAKDDNGNSVSGPLWSFTTAEQSLTEFCDCASQPASYTIDTDTLFIPNIFTPNGDGLNDIWRICPYNGSNLYPNSTVKIYSSMGFLLTQWNGFSSGWDGEYNGGYLDNGKYSYEITFNSTQKKTGCLCLYRCMVTSISDTNEACAKNCTSNDMYGGFPTNDCFQ